MQIQILKTRRLGKFCSSRTSGIRVGEMDQFFCKSAFWCDISQFFGPCRGLTHPEGRSRPSREYIWLVETEIAFFVEQQYVSRTTSGANCCIRPLRQGGTESLESCYSLIIQRGKEVCVFLIIVWFLLCQAYFSYCWIFFLRIVIIFSNQHVLLLHYEEA